MTNHPNRAQQYRLVLIADGADGKVHMTAVGAQHYNGRTSAMDAAKKLAGEGAEFVAGNGLSGKILGYNGGSGRIELVNM